MQKPKIYKLRVFIEGDKNGWLYECEALSMKRAKDQVIFATLKNIKRTLRVEKLCN